jgi:hypothetical protein
VVLVAQPNRLAQGMDLRPAGLLLGPPRSFVAGTAIWPADGHCSLFSESMRPPGSGETIGCPTQWRSLRGPVMARANPMAESLALNRSSSILASAAVKVFLAGIRCCAQRAASSAEFICANCWIRLSRRLADSCAPSTDLAETSGTFPLLVHRF